MEIFHKIDQREIDGLMKALRHIPPEAQKTTRRAVERHAKSMVATMRSIVPVDSGALKSSIRYRLISRGLKAVIFAGYGKTKRVRGGGLGGYAKHVEFGTEKRRFTDAQPFFVPVANLFRDRVNDSILRSLRAAVKKAGGLRG